MLLPLGFRGVVILELAIVQPKSPEAQTASIWAVYGVLSPAGVHGRLRAVSAVKRGVYIPQAPPARGLGGAASDSLKK